MAACAEVAAEMEARVLREMADFVVVENDEDEGSVAQNAALEGGTDTSAAAQKRPHAEVEEARMSAPKQLEKELAKLPARRPAVAQTVAVVALRRRLRGQRQRSVLKGLRKRR